MMDQQLNINSITKESISPPPERETQKRRYIAVDEPTRAALLELIDSKQITIKAAAEELSIHYSTAKNIVKLYRRYGRIYRLPKRQCHLPKVGGNNINLKKMKLYDDEHLEKLGKEENIFTVSSAHSRSSQPPPLLHAPSPIRVGVDNPPSCFLNPARYSPLIMQMYIYIYIYSFLNPEQYAAKNLDNRKLPSPFTVRGNLFYQTPIYY